MRLLLDAGMLKRRRVRLLYMVVHRIFVNRGVYNYESWQRILAIGYIVRSVLMQLISFTGFNG